jgi:GTPase
LSKDFDLEFERLLKESARVAAEFDASEEDQTLDQSQELSERHALRRVQGFSTELQDISEAEYRQLQLERVVLVGVWTELLRMRKTLWLSSKHLQKLQVQKFLRV